MELAGKTIGELAKHASLKEGTGASRGTMEKLWMNKVLGFERQLHEVGANCHRQRSVKPLIDVLEGGTRLLKDCSKNIKSLTGACYSKPGGRRLKPHEADRKVEKLEGEIDALRRRQKEEEKASEKQSQ